MYSGGGAQGIKPQIQEGYGAIEGDQGGHDFRQDHPDLLGFGVIRRHRNSQQPRAEAWGGRLDPTQFLSVP